MDSETHSATLAPPIFNGENYQLWAARMEAYLEATDLWEAVEEYEIHVLPTNPTVAQMKSHKEKKSRKSKARATLFASVTQEIFTRIVNQKSGIDVWNFLKAKYEGDEKVEGMNVLNLVNQFTMQRMKDSEAIKEYTNKLLTIRNRIWLLGSDFSNCRNIQKILVIVPERFDATISASESSKDLSKLTLAELNSSLQAQEQRRLMRKEGTVEGAFLENSFSDNKKACPYCKKKNHRPYMCWWRPDAKCNQCEETGHLEKVCKKHIATDVGLNTRHNEEELF